MKTILLPTDFSENSINAIIYALNAFGSKRNKFILLNAYRISPIEVEDGKIKTESFEEISMKGLIRIIKIIKNKFRDQKINIELISKLGYATDVIKKVANRKKADLTIMGTKGAGGLKEILIGSVTSETIKNLDCPVLAIPENAKFKTLKNIAFASDYKKFNKKEAFQFLLQITKEFSSEILVLHVQKNLKKESKSEKTEKLKLKSLFAESLHSFNTIEEKNPVIGIENFIKSREIDLVAILSRKHSFIHQIFNKSITEKLAMHTSIPLLALQN